MSNIDILEFFLAYNTEGSNGCYETSSSYVPPGCCHGRCPRDSWCWASSIAASRLWYCPWSGLLWQPSWILGYGRRINRLTTATRVRVGYSYTQCERQGLGGKVPNHDRNKAHDNDTYTHTHTLATNFRNNLDESVGLVKHSQLPLTYIMRI